MFFMIMKKLKKLLINEVVVHAIKLSSWEIDSKLVNIFWVIVCLEILWFPAISKVYVLDYMENYHSKTSVFFNRLAFDEHVSCWLKIINLSVVFVSGSYCFFPIFSCFNFYLFALPFLHFASFHQSEVFFFIFQALMHIWYIYIYIICFLWMIFSAGK